MASAPIDRDIKDDDNVHLKQIEPTEPIFRINAIELIQDGQGGVETTLTDRAARAAMEQNHLIPATGLDAETTRWEKWMFMLFRMSVGGTAINSYGGAKNQAFLNQHFRDGTMPFAGKIIPVNSYLLDLNGILFAVQLVLLLTIGPYADYGSWRPYILIFFETLVFICCFALAGINSPDQWQEVNALWFLGNLSLNVANVFYYAGFPAIVRNLPVIRQSEQAVFEGRKTPEEHDQLDSLSRAKFYNYCIVTASTINLMLLGIATGIAAGIGIKNTTDIILGYRYLIIFFALFELIGVIPYLYIFVRGKRPGQQLPDGTPFYLAGVKQIYQACRYVWDLKQFLIYLVAYFLFQEAFGASGNIQGILQNEVIHYSTIQLSGLTALDFFTGATGTLFVSVIQQRYKVESKTMLLYGGAMILILQLWGAIGAFTHVIGFHHTWEFWLANVWNFQAAAWNSYYVILLSEIVPQPKMYLFFALLNTVGKTSGFSGPFISSAIIDAAGGNTNMAFWFLFAMGLLGWLVLCFVDPKKAKIDVARFLEREARQLYSEQQRVEAKVYNL